MTPAERVLDELDSSQRGLSPKRLRLWLVSAAILVFYVVPWNLAGIDLQKLGTGLPKLAHWIAQAWPPKLAEVPLFALRTAETVAMAAIGTTLATLLAVPMAILASRAISLRCRACMIRRAGS